jgi:hypothetical protein
MRLSRKIQFFSFAVLLSLITSCTTHRSAVTTAPVNMQLNVTTSDLEYVGEVSGKSSQSFVLGLPVGGRRYYSAAVGVAGLLLPGNRGIQNAVYDALKQKPDADFVIPFAVDETVNRMFLGSKRTYKVRAKAFKLRSTK